MKERPRLDHLGPGQAVPSEDATRRAISDLQRSSPTWPRWNVVRQVAESEDVAIGQLLAYDPYNGSARCHLQKAVSATVGCCCSIVRVSASTAAYVIHAHPGDTIDGAETLSHTEAWSQSTLRCYETGRWKVETAAALEEQTPKPVGTWASTTTIAFSKSNGPHAETKLRLQDGQIGVLPDGTWAVANGVADWGYDEAASQGNGKWLYFYAVPASSGSGLTVRASDNPPTAGPTGFTSYSLVWATYMEAGATLRKVYQERDASHIFRYCEKINVLTTGVGSGPDGAAQRLSLASVVPASAIGGAAIVDFYCQAMTAPMLMNLYIDAVGGAAPEAGPCEAINCGLGWQSAQKTVRMPTPNSQYIWYMRQIAASNGTFIDGCGWADAWV